METPTTHPLTFRYWCKVADCYVCNYRYVGELEDFLEPDAVLYPQQSTCIKDSCGQIAHEGDIVEFRGDQVLSTWEDGSKISSAFLEDVKGALLKGEVSRNPALPCNMWLTVRMRGRGEAVFPLEVIKSGRVASNLLKGGDDVKSPVGVTEEILVGAGTSRFFKFRFWCNDFQTYAGKIWYSGLGDDALRCTGSIITEQCTGLRDKNGQDVYENDTFSSGGEVFEVRRSERVPCNLIAIDAKGQARGLDEALRNSFVTGRRVIQ